MYSATLGSDFAQLEKRRTKVKEFRELLRDILEPQHDDDFLLRFLKARDFDLMKSEKMIRESFKFKKKIGFEFITSPAYELPVVYRTYPMSFRLGLGRDSSLVRLVMVGLCDFKGYVQSIKLVDLFKLTVHELENDIRLLRDKRKNIENFGRIEEKTSFIMDFQGFTLKQFYDKAVINGGIQILTMYQDNYPETLKAAYLVNVPSYFNWIFNIFKPFLNGVTLSKLKVYRADEWRDELKNVIDPKLLPAFLGGDLYAPDEKCSDIINWNPKVPLSYYMKKAESNGYSDDLGMKTVTIQQRANLQVPVEVSAKGSFLRWSFCTKEYNIRFGLFFKGSAGNKEYIIPISNVDCQVIPEENELICEKAGTYFLHFDNSYSWLTAKQLSYKVEVKEPSSFIETNNN